MPEIKRMALRNISVGDRLVVFYLNSASGTEIVFKGEVTRIEAKEGRATASFGDGSACRVDLESGDVPTLVKNWFGWAYTEYEWNQNSKSIPNH